MSAGAGETTNADDVPGLCVLVSGRGRTLMNLCDRIARGEVGARLVHVFASRECAGLEWARGAGLGAMVLGEAAGDAQALGELFERAGASWVVLAGYTRLLPVPQAYAGRVVNIHPALLPAFGGPGMYGGRVHRAVLDAGCQVSGCTVHLCDARYDAGPIVAQAACAVQADDTPDTLAARVFALERELYPRALAALVRGGHRVEGGRVVLGEPVGPLGVGDTL